MTITVRNVRRGVSVRLTGAHARILTGLLADLVGSAPAAEAAQCQAETQPEKAPGAPETAPRLDLEGGQ